MAVSTEIFLGSAPDSWGVWFPDDPRQTSWERFLDELVAAGYQWLELGPYGFLPTDPGRLKEEVGRRGLKVSGGTVMGALHRPEAWDADVAAARQVASLVQAMGARFVIYLPEGYRDAQGNFTQVPSLDPDAWKRLATRASELGRILIGDFGVKMVFHPHADTHVGAQDEVERFLEETDASAVSLCLDTGHISYCGGDNLALIANFPDRIGYVHLKQVAPDVLAQAQAQQLSFAQAVRMGVTCEPPKGTPAMEPLIETLLGLGRDLFAIVEQDMYPCAPDAPFPIADRTRAYLNSCGLGRR